MKEVRAYIHSNRIGSVIAAIKESTAWGSDHNLTAYMVKGLLLPQSDGERHYSLDLGDEVINEYKLELHCEDEHVDEIVAIIRTMARTGQSTAGWVYVAEIARAIPIA